jgi:hypothetical protein
MPKKANQAKEKLETLAEHLRRGWKKLHPVKDELLEKVREAVRKQWDQEQSAKREKTKSRTKRKSKDQGHDYFY